MLQTFNLVMPKLIVRSFANVPGKRLEALYEKLSSAIGKENVATSDAVRTQHSTDESYHRYHMPDVVVFPQSTEHVSAVARVCSQEMIPMIPFGTGTGMEGGVVSVKGGVCVNLTKMAEMVEYNPQDFTATVQPGITRLQLNEYIKGDGLWFPVDPGADASLCGMAATSASGTNAVKYGTMRENVINLEVVLSDGQIVHTAGKARRTKKTVAGYNLTNLFVGSEGTLGFITSATLRLYGIPESVLSAVCQFDSINQAIAAVQEVLQAGISVARIELLDDVLMMATNRYSKLDFQNKPSIFLEFHGSETNTREQATIVENIFNEHRGQGFQWAVDLSERNKLWKARHNALYAVKSLLPGCEQYSTDVCVPISRLTEIIVEAKQDLVASQLTGAVLGHVGDGNFHVIMVFDPKDEGLRKRIIDFSDRLVMRALNMNGTCTGEHGIGLGKKKFLEDELGEGSLSVMKSIKKALDPLGLMNPGKVIPN